MKSEADQKDLLEETINACNDLSGYMVKFMERHDGAFFNGFRFRVEGLKKMYEQQLADTIDFNRIKLRGIRSTVYLLNKLQHETRNSIVFFLEQACAISPLVEMFEDEFKRDCAVYDLYFTSGSPVDE